MAPSPTQVVLAVALVVALGIVWYFEGRGRWRAFAQRRLVYGVPWGTALVVGINVGFYLFAQTGLRAWSAPVIYPFVSWSYFYPLGLVTAGIAHASPAHLVGNMSGTLVLAPIAEFAWSHYPRPRDHAESSGDEDVIGVGEGVSGRTTDGGPAEGERGGLLSNPWVRALVLFPGALFGAALATSAFAMGPGLGFSGAVYAIIGFALVTYPLSTVVAVVGASALGVLYDALSDPIVTAGVESGAPSPPSWAGIAFQAHALGFLLGVLAGVALLAYRHRRPDPGRVFFATLGVGLVQSLWLLVWPGVDDVYTLYRGAGVIALLAVALVVTLAVAVPGTDDRGPSGRTIGLAWLALAGATLLGVAGLGVLAAGPGAWLVPVTFLAVLLLAPGAALLASSRRPLDADVRRKAGVGLLLTLALVVALPGILFSSTVVGADPVPNDDGVVVGGYTVTYAEDAPSARHLLGTEDLANQTATNVTGVLLVNADRQIWTVGVQDHQLSHSGNGSVHVGGIGWRETVRAQRTGWEVVGGETAYAVDLFHDGDRTRSFASAPVPAEAEVAGSTFAVVPTESAFEIRVTSGGSVVDAVSIPAANQSTTVGGLEISTRSDGETSRVYAAGPDGRALLAVAETY